MNIMNVFDEYEAELQAKYDEEKASGQIEREMEAWHKRFVAERDRMIANGVIQTEPDEEEDEEEEEEEEEEDEDQE